MRNEELTQAALKQEASHTEASTYQRNLKNARERLKLSTADIANQLNLTVSIIEKIEENNFTDIAPIFAKGYVRAYAKLVKLSEESTVQIIQQIQSNEPKDTQQGEKKLNARRFIKDKKRWPTVVFYIVVVTMVFGLINYLQSSHKTKKSTLTPTEIAENNSLNDINDLAMSPAGDTIIHDHSSTAKDLATTDTESTNQ